MGGGGRDALGTLGVASGRKAYPGRLWGGEREGVAVARALASRPRVILADEPLAAIDDQNAKLVKRMLEEAAASGTTVIVATHKPTFQAGRGLRLPEGKLLVRRGLLKEAARAQPLWRPLLPQNGNGTAPNVNRPPRNRIHH